MQELKQLKDIIDQLNDASSFQETAEVLAAWTRDVLECRVVLLRMLQPAEGGSETGKGDGNSPQSWVPACLAQGADERFLRDETLVKVDECLCGRVATGTVDTDRPFFTDGGSFLWGDMASFQTEFSPGEIGALRGRCIREGFKSVGIFPLDSADGPIGSLLVADPRSGVFDDRTSLVETVAHIAGRILKNHLSREEEHQLLEGIQAALLPPIPPEIPGLELGVHFTSATTVARLGGDFYDVVDLGYSGLLLLVGDYSGKGIEAAGMAARARYSLEGLARTMTDLPSFLNKANNLLIEQLPVGRFVSVQSILIEPQHRKVTAALAGHTPPFILGGGQGNGEPTFRETDLEFHPPLGAFPDVQYAAHTIPLEDHETLLMYTDGVTESRRGRGGKKLTRKCRVAVVGATGAVGREMLSILEERDFPLRELVPLASERSAGKRLAFRGEEVECLELSPDRLRGVDIALFSAGGAVSKEYAPIARDAGCVVVDNSSAWRMDPQVPLIVPEVNPDQAASHQGIIANPNCSTIQMVVALQPLHAEAGIKRVVVSTYQAVSGSGVKAVRELQEQSEAVLGGRSPQARVYPHRIAFNCLPHIDVFLDDGSTKEERKMVQETKKIMGDQRLAVTATCVRVPVQTCHSEAVNVEFHSELSPERARDILAAAPGVQVIDDPLRNEYPLPVAAAGTDPVYVGRIRPDSTVAHGLNLWVVADNLRKGAALNTVQIAELLVEKNLVQLR